MSAADATVLITTYNRKDELRGAIESSLAQRGCRVEVLVVDDCSPDGTAEMVRGEYPEVRVEASPVNRGYIVHRNAGARLASGAVVVSIDDDAVFPSADTVAQTLEDLDDERVGAVAMPYIDVHIDPAVRQVAPDGGRVWAAEQYRGTAHAIRRDLFNALGGYREVLRHQGEEGDYCIRMLDAGRVVRLGRADPIHHLESPKRSWKKVWRQTARNSVLFGWHNVPMPGLLVHQPAATANMLLDGVKRPARLGSRVGGVWAGYGAVLGSAETRRRPVSAAAYRLSRTLRGGGPRPLEEIAGDLPPLREIGEPAGVG